MTKPVFLFSLIYLFATTSLAETVYVTDLLRLNVTEQPDSQSKTLTTISSGDPLTVLERQPGYAKVRTSDGQTGWAKSAYLVTEKPSRMILNQMEQQMAILEKKAAQAEKDVKSARENAEKYQQDLRTIEQASQLENEKMKIALKQNQEYESSMKRYESSIPLNFFLVACIVLFISGISLGWYIVDYRLRKRHGGFRL